MTMYTIGFPLTVEVHTRSTRAEALALVEARYQVVRWRNSGRYRATLAWAPDPSRPGSKALVVVAMIRHIPRK